MKPQPSPTRSTASSRSVPTIGRPCRSTGDGDRLDRVVPVDPDDRGPRAVRDAAAQQRRSVPAPSTSLDGARGCRQGGAATSSGARLADRDHLDPGGGEPVATGSRNGPVPATTARRPGPPWPLSSAWTRPRPSPGRDPPRNRQLTVVASGTEHDGVGPDGARRRRSRHGRRRASTCGRPASTAVRRTRPARRVGGGSVRRPAAPRVPSAGGGRSASRGDPDARPSG